MTEQQVKLIGELINACINGNYELTNIVYNELLESTQQENKTNG